MKNIFNRELKYEKHSFNLGLFSSFFQKIINMMKNSSKNCWNLFYKNFLQDFYELGCCARKEIITFISNTKLLIEDDQAFLNSFASDILTKYENYNLTILKWKFKPATVLSYILAGSFVWLSWCISDSKRSTVYTILDSLFIFIIVAVTIGYISHYFIYYHFKNNIEENLKQLKELSNTSININSLIKKLINIVQEAEIIARGFTFASLKVPAQRLEFSSRSSGMSVKRQYPELRENIFCWIRNIYYRYRQATLDLYHLYPLQPLLPVHSHYLATTSLDEFGPLLKLDLNKENEKEQLFEVSDMFSISSLKSIFQLMEVQQSEFYRLFSLGFIPDALVDMKQDPLFALKTFSQLIPFIKQLIDDDDKTLRLLNSTFNYYKSLEISNLLSDERNLPNKLKNSPYSTINLAIHSLNLHLRAALKRVWDAELLMEQIEQDVNAKTRSQIDAVLNPCLNEVKSELDAGKECLAETEEQLNLLTGRKLPVDNLHIIPPTKCHFPEQEHKITHLTELDEPVIHDQVFEAYTDRIEMGRSELEDNEIYTKEEKIRMQKEREASVHLLKELRSVLVTKAEEHKLREEKALGIVQVNKLNLTEIEQSELSKSLQHTKEKVHSEDQMLEENSSEGSHQGNHTDKSIETLKENDEIERWELLTEKELNSSESDKNDDKSKNESGDDNNKHEVKNNETPMDVNYTTSVDASFASSVAALVAARCRNLGLQMQTFSTKETEECYGDDDDDDDDDDDGN
ncbi:vezatin-like isoform X2 [Centruroides vittatus]